MPHVTEEIWSQFHDTRLIVSPWPHAHPRDAEATLVVAAARDAAAIFRRSGVRVELEGDAARIFEAVVRPGRAQADGNVEVEKERLRKEIERAEKMLGNPGFTEKAPPDVVQAEREKLERYRRELDALGG
jgi:valyl-tRNA synthetase